MIEICAHEGWGRYVGEEGLCPPPAALNKIPGGVECPTCGYRMVTITTAEAMSRMYALDRETATTARETR